MIKEPNEKTSISRLAKRGVYDEQSIYSILDESLFCTIAFQLDGEVFQLPTGFCRISDKIYIHGSVGSHFYRALATEIPVCISATLMDGLVVARSAFHHSVNYRSVVIFSKGKIVEDQEEMYEALKVFTNKMIPGRWDDTRHPNEKEWKQTMILSFPIEEASAKVRTGDPVDDKEDLDSEYWAGIIPLKMLRLEAQPALNLNKNVTKPSYL